MVPTQTHLEKSMIHSGLFTFFFEKFLALKNSFILENYLYGKIASIEQKIKSEKYLY
jgi:hypothetical protein